MNKYFFLIFLFAIQVYSQIETDKWQKREVDFRIEQLPQREYNLITSDLSTLLISAAQITYYKLISEHDGDNCPFYPSCSTFFVESVEQTNILKGSLMFADRFTRDINFFKGISSYPIHKTGKFHDPLYKYVLGSVEKIVELEQFVNE